MTLTEHMFSWPWLGKYEWLSTKRGSGVDTSTLAPPQDRQGGQNVKSERNLSLGITPPNRMVPPSASAKTFFQRTTISCVSNKNLGIFQTSNLPFIFYLC